MSSRRGGRRYTRKLSDRSLEQPIPTNNRTATRDGTDEPAVGQQPSASAPVAVDAVLLVADPRYVQPATLTGCDVPSCTSAAVPDEWALLDLDTGNELPYRLCGEHELAWMRRATPR